MLNDIISAIPLGFFLSFMIGPVFFVLLETSVVKGFKAAIIFDLGVVLADIIFILIAYFSSYRLIQIIYFWRIGYVNLWNHFICKK
jgi:threonine/homoserine/homoserine lactone efflux protein